LGGVDVQWEGRPGMGLGASKKQENESSSSLKTIENYACVVFLRCLSALVLFVSICCCVAFVSSELGFPALEEEGRAV